MDTINAIYVKSTHEILYSRSNYDFRYSEDKSVFVDGGNDYFRYGGDIDNIVVVKLNVVKLLSQILHYDFVYGNDNAELNPYGYHGKFKLDKYSNKIFFRELIVNWQDIEFLKDEIQWVKRTEKLMKI